jgi:anoctamin-10/anoctamin-7
LIKEYLQHALWKPVDPNIINDIRDYFGSYIAIYFGWLLHYTKYLIGAAIIGVIVFVVEMATHWGVDSRIAPFYSLFIALWATVYIEFWKRR